MTRGTFVALSDDQERSICESYRSGKTMADIAASSGFSVGPVRRVLAEHAIAMRSRRERSRMWAIRDEVVGLYKSGWSMNQLATHFHCCRNSLSALIGLVGARRPVPISPCTFNVAGETDCALLAGLLLGEGSIVRWNTNPRIDITNTDRSIIGWLSNLGGRVYRNRPRADARIKSQRPCYVWSLPRAADVYRCLIWIQPYLMGPKAAKAQGAIRTLEAKHGFRPTEAMRERAHRVPGDEAPDRWSRSA